MLPHFGNVPHLNRRPGYQEMMGKTMRRIKSDMLDRSASGQEDIEEFG